MSRITVLKKLKGGIGQLSEVSWGRYFENENLEERE